MTTVPLRPRISAYPLAALSILLLALVVTAVYLSIQELSRTRNRSLLRSTLRIGSVEEQEQLATRLYQVHPWISTAVRALTSLPPPQDRRGIAGELFGIHRALRANRSGLALQQYNQSTYLSALQQQEPAAPELRLLPTQFAELARLVGELERGLLRERLAAERLERAEGRHLLLAQDLALFLGLPDTVATRTGFYVGGVLADLPVLTVVPDNLTSSDDLRESLLKQGTAPRIESPNKQQAFVEKIESLRTASRELEEEFRTISQEVQVVQAQLLGQRAALELSNKRTLATIEQTLELVIPPSAL